MVEEAVVPVADAAGSLDFVVPLQAGVRMIVYIVAEKRGLMGTAKAGWIAAVTENLEDVGVGTVVDYIRMALEINKRLERAGHHRLHENTVRELFEEACEIAFGPEAED